MIKQIVKEFQRSNLHFYSPLPITTDVFAPNDQLLVTSELKPSGVNFIIHPESYDVSKAKLFPRGKVSREFNDSPQVNVERIFESLDEDATLPSTLDCAVGFGKVPLGSRINMPIGEFHKIAHETVAFALTQKLFQTDVKLSEVFGINETVFDVSPDVVYFAETKSGRDRYVFLELKTSQGDDKDLNRKYENALSTYTLAINALQTRMNIDAAYFVIAVSKNRVISNCRLNKEQVQCLVKHYKLGLKIYDSGLTAGYDPAIGNLDSVLREMKSVISETSKYCENKTTMREEEDLIVTNKMINHWKELEPNCFLKAKDLYAKSYERTQASILKAGGDDIRKTNLEHERKFNKESESDSYCIKKSSIVRFPLIIPKLFRPEKDLFPTLPAISEEGSVMQRIWSQSFRSWKQPKASRNDLMDMSYKTSEEYEKMDYVKVNKRLRSRVRLNLSSDERSELAKRGVQAKSESKKKPEEAKQTRKESKKWFPMNADTSDIDQFLFTDFEKLFEPTAVSTDIIGLKTEILNKIIKEQMKGDVKDAQKLFEAFYKTKLGHYLSLIDVIIEELLLSLSQFCDPDEFVLKHLSYFDAWLLLKPCGPSKQIFYSILWNEKLFEEPKGVFEQSISVSKSYRCTLFNSLERHKLGHFGNASAKVCALMAGVCDVFNRPSDSLLSHFGKDQDPQLMHHVGLTFLLYMHNKRQTSTSLQVIRYMYNDVMKMNPFARPNPLKSIRKFENKPRNRLLVWIYNHCIGTFKLMSENPPVTSSEFLDDKKIDPEGFFGDEDEDSQDKFSGLYSWVDFSKIDGLKQSLFLSYMGYFFNKDEGVENTGFFKIFNKVLQEELKLRKARPEYLGWNDCDDPDNHEFSPSVVLASGKILRRKLDKIAGGNFDGRLWEKLNKMLESKTAEYIATLKASSVMDHDGVYNKDGKINKRDKLIKRVIEMLRSNEITTRIWDRLYNVMKMLEKKKIRANLFRKAQIGGPREIFVLEAIARIGILFCESISRVISEEIPSEMLTKGSVKQKKSSEHYNKVMNLKRKNDSVINCISSNDATTWCQRFVMPVFSCFMMPILPKELFSIYTFMCNLMTEKQLELPKFLLDQFIENKDQKTFEPALQELKDQFLGQNKKQNNNNKQKNDLLEKGTTFLQNRSNFMQGIWHYSSSLLHCGYMELIHEFNQVFVKSLRSSYPFLAGTTLVQNYKASSDDSSEIITFIHPKKLHTKAKKFLIFLSTVFSYMSGDFGMHLTIKRSDEKSTQAAFSQMEEFNSVWTFRNTLRMPFMKQVYAAMMPQVMPELETRNSMFHDLTKQVTESGGSTHLAACVQEAQMRVHYSAYGGVTSLLFEDLVKLMIKLLHPACCAFVFQPECLAGVVGFDPSFYWLIKNNEVTRKTEAFLRKHTGLEVNDTGKVTTRVSFMFGGAVKWEAFINSLKIPDDWKLKIDRDPEFLYRKSKTNEESLIKLYSKALTPSVLVSLGLKQPHVMYTSTYLLFTPCVKVRTETEDGPKSKKQSLLAFLRSVEHKDDMKLETLDVLFPASELYDSVLEQVKNCDTLLRVPVSKQKSDRLVTIILPRSAKISPISLMDAVKHTWFFHKTVGNRVTRDHTLLVYQNQFPWLNLTAGPEGAFATLKDSPFRDHISLVNFIRSLTPDTTSFRVLGPITSGLPLLYTIKQIISRCSFKTHKLVELKGVTSKLKYNLHDFINAKLMLYKGLSILPEVDKIDQIKREIVLGPSLVNENSDLKSATSQLLRYNKKTANLAVLQMYLRAMKNPPKEKTFASASVFRQYAELANCGTYGYFSIRQRFNPLKKLYEGIGVYVCSISGVKFSLSLRDNKLAFVLVEKIENLFKTDIAESLKDLVNELVVESAIQTGEGKPKAYFNLTTGKVRSTMKSSKEDVPVYEMAVNMQVFDSQMALSVDEDGALRLIQLIDNKKITVLRFNPSIKVFDEAAVKDEETKCVKISDFWMNYRSMPSSELLPWVKSCVVNSEKVPEFSDISDYTGTEKNLLGWKTVSLWLKKTFEERVAFTVSESLRRKYQVHVEEVADEAELTPEDMEELMFVPSDFDFELSNEWFIDPEFKPSDMGSEFEMEADFTDFIEAISEKRITSSTKISHSLLMIHPFWDLTINKLMSELGSKRFFEILNSDFKVESRTEYEQFLAYLTDDRKRPVGKYTKDVFEAKGDNELES